MAYGTLKFDTLTTSDTKNTSTDKSIDTSYLLNGTAKVWVNINADGAGTADTFNISSITDTATGRRGVVFSNAMGNANYSLSSASGSGNVRIMLCDNDRTTTLSNIAVYTKGDTNSYADDITFFQAFGDLA